MSNLSIKLKTSGSALGGDLSVLGKVDGFYEVSYVGGEQPYLMFVVPLLLELIMK